MISLFFPLIKFCKAVCMSNLTDLFVVNESSGFKSYVPSNGNDDCISWYVWMVAHHESYNRFVLPDRMFPALHSVHLCRVAQVLIFTSKKLRQGFTPIASRRWKSSTMRLQNEIKFFFFIGVQRFGYSDQAWEDLIITVILSWHIFCPAIGLYTNDVLFLPNCLHQPVQDYSCMSFSVCCIHRCWHICCTT